MYIDKNKKYALVLEGGGARGAYQVGVWKALDELGIKYEAVSGTSVGALNGAMMAMRDLDLALKIWNSITFSKVMDVNDEGMRELCKGNFHPQMLGIYFDKLKSIIKSRGVSTKPLRDMLERMADEERIRSSDVNLYFTAYCTTDKKGYELDAKELPKGKLHDMLLASSCLPIFQRLSSDGKEYLDGGFFDTLPVHALVSRGYKNIIVVRLFGFGVVRRTKIPKDVNIITLKPSKKLCSVINFDTQISRDNIELGYNDTMKFFEGKIIG